MTGPAALSPEEISKVSFENKRRGYDPAAVDKHVKAAAATVSGLQDKVSILDAKVEALTAQLEAAKQAAKAAAQSPLELDDQALIDRVGVEAARLLSDARTAASERLAEADAEALKIRAEAEKLFAERSEAADVEAERIRANARQVAAAKQAEAESAAAELLTAAKTEVEVARSEVDRESVDAEASAIIHEAEVARRQILGDLLRRRGAAKRQIEQLRAGRERLLQSHETVRRALDEITQELSVSMSEARAAANAAGHSISDGSIEEIEAELEAARMVGLLDTGNVPVVRSPALPKSSSVNQPVGANDTAAKPERNTAAKPERNTAAKPERNTAAKPENKSAAKPAVASKPSEKSKKAVEPKKAESKKTKAESKIAEAVVEEAGDEPADGAPTPDNVVELKAARADVDTGSHPANRRAPVSQPEVVLEPEVEEPAIESDSVDALFATLHDATANADVTADADVTANADVTADADVADKLTVPAKSSAPKSKKKANLSNVSVLDTSGAPSTALAAAVSGGVAEAPAGDEALVDSVSLARRLKRVLADEQSRVMSTIKHAEVVPDLDGVLFSVSDHRSGYWTEVLDQLDDPTLAGSDANQAIDDLVDTIRRRVGDALENADGDAEAALTALRSIYRGIKTQLISETAELVSGSFLVTS